MINHLSDALFASNSPLLLSQHLVDRGFRPGAISLLHTNGAVEDLLFDQSNPGHFLRGREAPESVTAVAICFEGTCRDGTGDPNNPILVVETLSAAGDGQSLVRVDEQVMACASPQGLIPDSLCRFFGLSTPGPERGTSDLWLFVWLADLLRQDRPWDREALLAAHPAIHQEEISSALTELDGFVNQRHAELAEVANWHSALSDALAGRFVAPTLSAVPYASWFDEGSFSRAVLAEITESLLAIATFEPELVARVSSMLE